LFYAESETGETWDVRPGKLLSGRLFGQFRLHYPQVVRSGESYELFFTLRDELTKVDGIFRMRSGDGLEWEGLEQLLPLAANGIVLRRRQLFELRVPWARVDRPLASFLARANWKLVQKLYGGANDLGFSHPHVLDADGETRVMYYHSDNHGPFERWADIGRC